MDNHPAASTLPSPTVYIIFKFIYFRKRLFHSQKKMIMSIWQTTTYTGVKLLVTAKFVAAIFLCRIVCIKYIWTYFYESPQKCSKFPDLFLLLFCRKSQLFYRITVHRISWQIVDFFFYKQLHFFTKVFQTSG